MQNLQQLADELAKTGMPGLIILEEGLFATSLKDFQRLLAIAMVENPDLIPKVIEALGEAGAIQ
jgi:hypothetical protein